MKEVWKDVVGFEGLYKVSNTGKILSLNYARRGISKVMRPSKTTFGYCMVNLRSSGKRKIKLVHIAVAKAFIPNPESKPFVNHIDGNKQNNRADNLEWVTAKENVQHAYRTGLHEANGNRGKFGIEHYASKPVLQYDLQGNFVKKWDCYSDAARFYDCTPAQITNCATGRIKTCKGFMWKPMAGGEIPQSIPRLHSRKSPKKIEQLSLDGELIRTWNGYAEIYAETDYKRGVESCCQGRNKTAYGYIWRYTNGLD